MEERLPPHGDAEGDVWVLLRAAGVAADVFDGVHLQDVPLDALVEAAQVDAVGDRLVGFVVVAANMDEVNLCAVVSPGTKLHLTSEGNNTDIMRENQLIFVRLFISNLKI